MYCRVFACDFDGTAEAGGELAPEVAAALSFARARGIVNILVTGRVQEEIESMCPDLSMFDAVVAENGAVVCLPQQGRVIQLGSSPPEEFLGRLRSRGIPFHCGLVVLGTWASHAAEVLDLVHEFALDAQLVFNRQALMLLPSGVSKASGVRRALVELRRSHHNLIAFGDAENDVALFQLAELAVAAAGASPSVAEKADDRVIRPGAAGVGAYIQELLAKDGNIATPARHQVRIGTDSNGESIALPASGTNIMISGDPHSGKSWLIGLIAEQLLDRGYQLCIIDPEGDHLSLAERPRTILFGKDLALPEPTAVSRLFHNEMISVVLDVAGLPRSSSTNYVREIVLELQDRSALDGVPHWVLIDEAHYFFPEAEPFGARFDGPVTFLFSTYRPSLVSSAIYATVGAHLLTGTLDDDERYALNRLLETGGPMGIAASLEVGGLERPYAGLLVPGGNGSSWRIFTPLPRLTEHAHHARKYADTRLPNEQSFWFLQTGGGSMVARNLVEFHRIIRSVPLSSLRHHLRNGDFSRWIADVLGDDLLAKRLREIESATRRGATPDRETILARIESEYQI